MTLRGGELTVILSKISSEARTNLNLLTRIFIFQHVLVLCNAIGTPLDSKYIEIGKLHLQE